MLSQIGKLLLSNLKARSADLHALFYVIRENITICLLLKLYDLNCPITQIHRIY